MNRTAYTIVGFTFALTLALAPGAPAQQPRPLACLLAQPVHHTQHGADALEIMPQTQVFIGSMLIVVVIRQGYADQRYAEDLRQLR